MLLVYTLSILKLLEVGFNRMGAVSGSIWPCEGPEWVHGLRKLAKWFLCGFCCISATKKQGTAQ